jgi:heparin binding hemagglutinin HbhA
MTPTTTTRSNKTMTTRIPDAVFAVAGAGELAYVQLRKLPAVTAGIRAQLPGRVAELRADLPTRMAELRADLPTRVAELRSEIPARVSNLRADFPNAVNAFVVGAYHVYHDLVARGERVVAEGRAASNGATRMAPKAAAPTKATAPRAKAARPAAAPRAGATRRASATTEPTRQATGRPARTAAKQAKAPATRRTRPAAGA